MFLLVQGEAAIITKRLRQVDDVLPNGLVWQNLGQASRIYSRDSVDCSTSRMRFVKPSISYMLLSAFLCVCTVVKEPAEAELRWQDGKKEPIRVRIVAMAWNHPRSSFFSNEEIFVAEKALNQSEGVTVFLTTHYMDEADRVAQRVAIIDHGKIVTEGSPADLKRQTDSDSLEAAFLALTGSTIRDEAATAADHMRQVVKMWGNRR